MFLAGIAFAAFYPLDRESHQETRRKLRARHEATPGE
jgi:hypothetical protein